MEKLQEVEVQGLRVLTTKQIAELYGTNENVISHNFRRNKDKYVNGKHYIELQGAELHELKSRGQFVHSLKQVKHLYAWTEKGALLHAKSLNTDKAWEVYDYLVDFYFRVKEEPRQQSLEEKQEIVPVKTTVEKVPDALPVQKEKKLKFEIPEMNNPILILHTLLDLAETKNIKVRTLALEANRSLLYCDRIGIRETLSLNEIVYELAYELAHAIIHYNAGNIINNPLQKYYNEQAERMASMMIELTDIRVARMR